MFLKNNSNYPIGLDISDLSIKLFQLDKAGDKITIQAIGKTDLPKGLIEEGEIRNRTEVLKAINSLIAHPKYGKVSSNEVVTCLPEAKTFVKLIEIDKNPNDISDVIKVEVEKHIPISIDEMYFDWQIIKDHPDKQLILVGAAPKSIVDDYTSLFDEAGLSLAAIEIESTSICRSMLAEENYKYKDQISNNYGIIDIGAKSTNMIVYAQNTILFTVSMPVSGEEITETIAKKLKIDLEQAEKAKIICGFDENKAEGVIKNILSEMTEDLVKRIKDVIKFYEYHYPELGKLEEIRLCGGGSCIDNIDKILSAHLGMNVTLGNPFTNITGANEKFVQILSETHTLNSNFSKGKKDDIDITVEKNTGLSFATAIGLALRGIFIDVI